MYHLKYEKNVNFIISTSKLYFLISLAQIKNQSEGYFYFFFDPLNAQLIKILIQSIPPLLCVERCVVHKMKEKLANFRQMRD